MKVDPVVVNAYADALLQAVKARGEMPRAAAEAASLAEVIRSHPRLQVFLESPSVRDEDKIALVNKVLAPKYMDLMTKFLLLMLKRRRLEHFVPALLLFRTMVVREQGMREASFTTAVPLSDAEKKRLEEVMEKATGFDLHPTFRVEPAVLGGVYFRCEDILIDTTLRTGLSNVRRRMLKTQVVT